MEKFKGKYKIGSSRLAGWDYGSNAGYFVTICTEKHSHDFGEIIGDEMVLTPLGQAATDCWNKIPVHFPFVLLDGFVVMPNHVHGIVIINKPGGTLETQFVETQDIASLRYAGGRFGSQSQNLASIMRGYKIGVTKFARQNGIAFLWQEWYYEPIIRNEFEYDHICQYIQGNPSKWVEDRFYKPVILESKSRQR